MYALPRTCILCKKDHQPARMEGLYCLGCLAAKVKAAELGLAPSVRPCPQGHMDGRRLGSNECVTCSRLRGRVNGRKQRPADQRHASYLRAKARRQWLEVPID